MKTAIPKLIEPRWDAVVLVCKDCSKRSSGAKALKAKALVGVVRHATKRSKPRTRTVVTGCMGLCPKKATAVAITGAGRSTRMVAVHSEGELETVLAMTDRPAAAAATSDAAVEDGAT